MRGGSKDFCEAVVLWVIQTDQVRYRRYHVFFGAHRKYFQSVDILKHPSLYPMIDAAANARNGVVIPDGKTACELIMKKVASSATRPSAVFGSF